MVTNIGHFITIDIAGGRKGPPRVCLVKQLQSRPLDCTLLGRCVFSDLIRPVDQSIYTKIKYDGIVEIYNRIYQDYSTLISIAEKISENIKVSPEMLRRILNRYKITARPTQFNLKYTEQQPLSENTDYVNYSQSYRSQIYLKKNVGI